MSTRRRYPHIDAMGLPNPRAGQMPHFLYAVEFIGGVVKVGVTWNPRSRVIALQLRNGRVQRAACVALPVRCHRHLQERRLIDRVAAIAAPVAGRREFFTGVSFDAVAGLLPAHAQA